MPDSTGSGSSRYLTELARSSDEIRVVIRKTRLIKLPSRKEGSDKSDMILHEREF
jgi:hypothetical protein